MNTRPGVIEMSGPEDNAKGADKSAKPLIRFYRPSELLAYEIPRDYTLAGEFHLQRQAMSLLVGLPGVGKTELVMSLGVCGVKGCGSWLGVDIKTRFRTLFLQCENGEPRLQKDLQRRRDAGELPADADEWFRISSIPAIGFNLQNAQLRAEIMAELAAFQPDLVVIDPWNAIAKRDMIEDYQIGYDDLMSMMGVLERPPCLLVLHHLKKLKVDDFKLRGRALLSLVSGSYFIGSRARSVFVVMAESPFANDPVQIVTVAKNSDGPDLQRVAMSRIGGRLVDVTAGYDWTAYDSGQMSGGARQEKKVTDDDVLALFEFGHRSLSRVEAADMLMSKMEIGRTTAFEELKARTDAGGAGDRGQERQERFTGRSS